ncbi:MAG: TonB-dependent receptor [Proteobacteria bacterium]|nr:TonB-dependent receptor [Pseudomonadota bacterium]
MHAHLKSVFAKNLLSTTAAAALLALATPTQSFAQTQTAQGEPASLDEIVVTGSRIVRDGFEAPTPVSVLSSDDLNVISTPNIADAVNRLPALQGSLGTTNASTNVSSGTGGVNQLNLRALSAVRTLVLLDGKRIVGATLAGFENNGSTPDINGFPGGLVSRVDVVTGGASAVYGSDALAGVVNFVLDREYTGIKGEIQGGVTTYGDDENYKLSLTGGTPFAGGRGHILLFGEHTFSAGIVGNPRPWNDPKYSTALIVNPAYVAGNGQPQYIITGPVGLSNATAGGLILSDNLNGTNSPFRGIQFLADGKQAPFRFGQISGLQMVGGDYDQSNIWKWPSLDLEVQRTNIFNRLSYDLADNVNVYTEISWAYTHALNRSLVPDFRLGNINVRVDNAFLPENIRSQMTTLGVASLTMGSFMAAGPRSSITDPATGNTPIDIKADNGRTLRRYVAGLEGNFNVADANWKWDAYYARSSTHNSTRSPDNIQPARLNQAIDAVRNPANGSIVCRSTLTNPNDGCIPYNIFGTNVNGPTEWKYLAPRPGYAITILSQDVMSASLTGEPFSTWAGPVSLAFGGEHRKEKVRGLASTDDVARRYFAGNYIATNAQWHVTEGFVETVVPLAKEESWADSLELNAAVRGAQYSESGFNLTWKAGLIYVPTSDLTLRVTQSRDIRAPNLGDLFNQGRAGTGNVNDPFRNNESVTIVSADVGNPNLQPEKADTTGLGLVYSPGWLDGFTASLDYYRIHIKDAITTLDGQRVLNRCFAGVTSLCAGIQRGPVPAGQTVGPITFMAVQPQNVLTQKTDGLDFEFAYNTPLDRIIDGMNGEVALRGLANYVFKLDTSDTDPVTNVTTIIKGAGVMPDSGGIGLSPGLATPHFRWTTSFTYTLEAFSGTVTWRGTGSGVYNNAFVVCSSGCPASTATAPTINQNSIGAVQYIDLAANYKIMDDHVTMYAVIQNALNRDPPMIAAGLQNGFYGGLDNDNFDRTGRMFRIGARFAY